MAMKVVGYIRFEHAHIFYEVLRIKRTIDRSEKQSDDELFKSLKRLQQMPMSIEILKETEIGKSVNNLRKHESKELRNLVRTLIKDWRQIANAYYNATTAIAESNKAIVGEEGGLPPPPSDDGAFFASPTPMASPQKLECKNDAARLEASKRKLHERYQEAENAKKQRKTKMVELHELPKQSLAQMNQQTRPSNHRRQWARRRRS